jgi:hypothetical protein
MRIVPEGPALRWAREVAEPHHAHYSHGCCHPDDGPPGPFSRLRYGGELRFLHPEVRRDHDDVPVQEGSRKLCMVELLKGLLIVGVRPIVGTEQIVALFIQYTIAGNATILLVTMCNSGIRLEFDFGSFTVCLESTHIIWSHTVYIT